MFEALLGVLVLPKLHELIADLLEYLPITDMPLKGLSKCLNRLRQFFAVEQAKERQVTPCRRIHRVKDIRLR